MSRPLTKKQTREVLAHAKANGCDAFEVTLTVRFVAATDLRKLTPAIEEWSAAFNEYAAKVSKGRKFARVWPGYVSAGILFDRGGR